VGTVPPSDGDRETTVELLEAELLSQMSSILLACESEENADLGIVTLDYMPRDTLHDGQEECPPFLDHCFVYDGFMGLHIEEGKDMDAAIQATRETIEALMEANNFGIASLEDIEYLGPPFANADAVERSSPENSLQAEGGSGLGTGGIVGIGMASLVALVGLIAGFAYGRRGEDDLGGDDAATNVATTLAPAAEDPVGTEPFDDGATTGAVASSVVTGSFATSPYGQGTDVIADTGEPSP